MKSRIGVERMLKYNTKRKRHMTTAAYVLHGFGIGLMEDETHEEPDHLGFVNYIDCIVGRYEATER